jgi:hypothetical protein
MGTAALAAVGAAMALGGGKMFSPGPLNASRRASHPLGGVASHAELETNCSACHAPLFSTQSQSERCMDCHRNVKQQQEELSPLHGMISNALECRTCHLEHRGVQAPPTSFELFDHDWTAFPLTGRHRGLECSTCHTTGSYRGTPSACVACHAEPKVHQGRFGVDCAACHSTATWDGATFDHKFPLNHGGGPKHRPKACSLCHTADDGYKTYTCYECHRHDPRKTQEKHLKRAISKIDDCATCHPTGRKRPSQPPRL